MLGSGKSLFRGKHSSLEKQSTPEKFYSANIFFRKQKHTHKLVMNINNTDQLVTLLYKNHRIYFTPILLLLIHEKFLYTYRLIIPNNIKILLA